MSHTELHRLESARTHDLAVPAARLAATITEAALVTLVIGVWVVTCMAG
jgi:hypothetical protein